MVPPNWVLFVAGLVAYQLVNRCAHQIVKRINPDFYMTLKADKHRKLAPYFVFPLGFLFTLLTTPICTAAYNDTSSVTDLFGLDRPFTTNGKICLASRANLWTSELPLLSYSPEYIAHHVLSLSSLGLFLIGKGPRRPLYLIYAGLVTELLSDSAVLMRFHGRTPSSSPILRKILLANVASMVLLRLLPIIAHSAAMLETRADYLGGIASYCIHICRLSFVQLGALGYINAKAGRKLSLAPRDAAADQFEKPKRLAAYATVAPVKVKE
ncbi:hypothetical protein BDP81DRAFT_464755 [Colletotrichum phormii]|uniref:TLC domain-containing protein n=1 Tax=Colletotrichum phormii TaxID=359342 RepID=A0AAI9ZGT5_9PEZI|nr:uncharacterized protein BDP81DRAFT_464755 [Colletotrichum phormii]KAK1624191.1 hypothetical protein BDP81DRAFT_464755 [Colletotrichum phormii]